MIGAPSLPRPPAENKTIHVSLNEHIVTQNDIYFTQVYIADMSTLQQELPFFMQVVPKMLC